MPASAQAHYPVANLHAGWSEQDPADWIAALETVITPPTQVSQILPCTEFTADCEDAYLRFKART